MKVLIFLFLSSVAWGKVISVEELKARFMVSGEILVFDTTGKKLIRSGTEWRTWRNRDKSGRIEANWGGRTDDLPLVALHQVWQVKDDGTITAVIEQYAELKESGKETGPEFRKIVRKEEFQVENFGAINWVAHQTPEYRVVARLTPMLKEEPSVKSVNDFPIAGTEIIVSDSRGNLWASRVSLDAKYAGMITHRGSFFLSYFPFPGAKEIGNAQGRTIELNPEKDFYINIVSRDFFLPEGVQAKIYGRVDLRRKTEKLTSVRMIGSNQEAEFLKSTGG